MVRLCFMLPPPVATEACEPQWCSWTQRDMVEERRSLWKLSSSSDRSARSEDISLSRREKSS